MDPNTPRPRLLVIGDIVTMNPDMPRAAAMLVDEGRIAAIGDLASVSAAAPFDAVEVRVRGTVVPGFIDSHFYLQRGGIKILDLFPDREPDSAEFRRIMAETALDPDWSGAEPPSEAQRREGLRRVQPQLHALGITGIADPWATAEAMPAYQAAHRAGELTMRVTAMPYFEGLRDHLQTPDEVMAALGGLGVGSGFGDDTLAFGAFKLYVDGEGKRQQALRETPWPATGDRGIQAIEREDLSRIALFCARNGWALGIHAIGGAAMRMSIEVLSAVDTEVPLRDLRFRLIHAYLEPTAEVMAEAARLGVIVSSQPAIQWNNGAWLRDTLGDSADEANPLRSWLNAGVSVALGSDGPYFPFDPLRLMWFVRTRHVRGSDTPVGTAQRISPEEALRGLTAAAARAALVDDRRGTLAAGMLADWVEVSVDPLACTDDELLSAHVERTVVGGRTVYER